MIISSQYGANKLVYRRFPEALKTSLKSLADLVTGQTSLENFYRFARKDAAVLRPHVNPKSSI